VKNFLINLLPFKFDKCAPLKPPKNDPIIKINNRIIGSEPCWLRAIAPTAFQKIPTVRKVILIDVRKSNPKVFINNIVTNNPVPEEMEPFRIAIIKVNILNLIIVYKLNFFFIDINPKFGFNRE
tara:strand:+ start:128 stop:499 length:372 start_codon:yes stop_codon:yes gene_type:complete